MKQQIKKDIEPMPHLITIGYVVIVDGQEINVNGGRLVFETEKEASSYAQRMVTNRIFKVVPFKVEKSNS